MTRKKLDRGRPLADSPKEETLRFRVTPDLKEQIKEMAAEKHITMSALVTILVTEYLDEKDQSLSGVRVKETPKRTVNGD